MKRKIFTLLVLSIFASVAEAVPCGNLLTDVDVITYNFVHSPKSQRKALLQAAFQRTTAPLELTTLFADRGIVTNAFSVSDTLFTTNATLNQIGLLRQFSIAATVSLNDYPDKCFFVWFSPSNQFSDLNVIMNVDTSGTLSLGSNNKLDDDLYMTLSGM